MTRDHTPVHPGEILREDYMLDYNLTVSDVAERTNLSEKDIQALIDEQIPIDLRIADALGKFFGTSSQHWLNLQSNYESRLQSGSQFYNRKEKI
jgi:addiction module HigA family antidote